MRSEKAREQNRPEPPVLLDPPVGAERYFIGSLNAQLRLHGRITAVEWDESVRIAEELWKRDPFRR